jgi:5-methylcytosine-specific restriction enzyme A
VNPVRLCFEPGCPNLATGKGRCDEHRKPLERERSRKRREATKGVYKKQMWQRRRLQAIDKAPLCPGVLDEPCPHTAIVEEVDHIVPLSQGGAAYDADNLQALCSRCHQRKTAHENARTP